MVILFFEVFLHCLESFLWENTLILFVKERAKNTGHLWSELINNNCLKEICTLSGFKSDQESLLDWGLLLVKDKLKLLCSGFEPGRAIAPIPHCSWNCPLKKWPRGQFCPLQNFGGKMQEEAHTKKFSSVHKLQVKTERVKYKLFYRTFKVHSKVNISVTLYWTRTSHAQPTVVNAPCNL